MQVSGGDDGWLHVWDIGLLLAGGTPSGAAPEPEAARQKTIQRMARGGDVDDQAKYSQLVRQSTTVAHEQQSQQ